MKLTSILTDLKTWISNELTQFNTYLTNLNTWKTNQLARFTELKAAVLIKLNSLLADLKTWISNELTQFNTYITNFTTWKNNQITKLTELKTSVLTKLNALLSDLKTWISNELSQFNTYLDAINTWKTNIVSKLSDIKSSIYDKLTGIVDDIKNLKSSFSKAGTAIIEGLYDSIVEEFDKVIKIAKEKLGDLKDLTPNSPAKEGPFKTLPNWDVVFVDPLQTSLSKMSGLKSTLSDSLSGLSTQITPSSLEQTSTSSISNSYAGDTISVQIGTVNSQADVDYLLKELEARSKRKGFQMGVLR